MNEFDLAVIGGGPAGALFALAAAPSMRTLVLLRSCDLAASAGAPRSVEAVPGALLALLAEFGVQPEEIGVDQLHHHREIAWDSSIPRFVRSDRAAHVERPLVDFALLRRALHSTRITVEMAAHHTVARDEESWRGRGWRARYLVDATGRRALTAAGVVRPPRPWVARLWCFPAAVENPLAAGFKMAALPQGYAYRLSSRRILSFGLVGPAYGFARNWSAARQLISECGASWIARGMPESPICSLRPRVASLQWSSGDCDNDRLLRVGDAACARDALGSQGLGTSLSEALYAVAAFRSASGPDLLRMRQQEQRDAHIRALTACIDTCAWAAAPVWRRYREWLSGHSPSAERLIALRDGSLQELGAENGVV
ncbi:MAG TPA: hypothetical protein VGY99_22050 [Candidatus Binataceae bacterium]|jgi:flavin-dependent dehydrogenase|nr:hypothetical protein [Candidatus Binataceae bacterium]